MAEVLTSGRLISLVVLSIALSSHAACASNVCSTNAVVRKNGDLVIEGKVYSDWAALKTRIDDLKARKPDCFMSVTSEKGTSIKTIEHVAHVLQDMGVPQVGFLTEPDSH